MPLGGDTLYRFDENISPVIIFTGLLIGRSGHSQGCIIKCDTRGPNRCGQGLILASMSLGGAK